MAYPGMPKSDKERMAKYEAEEDLRTLIRAGEVKKDKARLKRALDCAKEQAKALASVKP